jgi:virulence-associated protein VagC
MSSGFTATPLTDSLPLSIMHTYCQCGKRLTVAARKRTKLFMSGDSQAENNPCAFQVQTWQSLIDSLAMFTNDFMEEGRRQPPMQKRTRLLATG